jgi:hypothetical protein
MDITVGLPVYTPEDLTDELAASLCVRVLRLDRERLDVLEQWLDAGAPTPLLLPLRKVPDEVPNRA